MLCPVSDGIIMYCHKRPQRRFSSLAAASRKPALLRGRGPPPGLCPRRRGARSIAGARSTGGFSTSSAKQAGLSKSLRSLGTSTISTAPSAFSRPGPPEIRQREKAFISGLCCNLEGCGCRGTSGIKKRQPDRQGASCRRKRGQPVSNELKGMLLRGGLPVSPGRHRQAHNHSKGQERE